MLFCERRSSLRSRRGRWGRGTGAAAASRVLEEEPEGVGRVASR